MSDPDVDVVTGLLQTLESSQNWVAQAYGNAPWSVMDLPAIVNIPGPATVKIESEGDQEAVSVYETRIYNISLLVAAKGQGVPGEVIGRVNPYYAKLRNLFLSHPLLGSPTSGIFRLEYQGDSGLSEIDLGGLYVGTRATISVTGRVRAPFAQGE